MKTYKHFISLGYFCSTALELEKIGLRSCSSPFDWCLSDWGGVEKAIETHFENFLEYNNLYQDKKDPSHYKDMEYGIAFFHDFNKYKPLKEQLPFVREKYNRRIDRFYKNIAEPTLFIRYISNEHGREELDYIEENYNRIINLLKSFNKDNDIIFIANSELKSTIIKIYSVEKDENDIVARWPLEKNEELYSFLAGIGYEDKQKNYERFLQKKKREDRISCKIRKKGRNLLRSIFYREYIHDKQY